ncbi:RecQ family ATP-dependent DNA helicase [Cesiribacter sp. SM1]|uniref:RecQ family ATP-dependent DNA helicase n=1 Tax=Cesiribacter sp. SM1 TaxID=2861196 RepID=UPI001CD500D7|nr:RecQ family ATP-dependent DNA helicase [Cesiribacter sp. SM1]
MVGVAFFDIEVIQQPKEKIASIGVFFEKKAWRTLSLHDFERLCEQATVLCGHNIFAHDIPQLIKAGISPRFSQKEFIDTLYLSPLLFPNKPYHRLIKDYQLVSGHINNPVEDAKLACVVLEECLQAFYSLPHDFRSILSDLLKNQLQFSTFFKLATLSREETLSEEHIDRRIHNYFKNKICQNADINTIIQQSPLILGYALALINATDPGSIIPPWLLFKFPQLTALMHQLRSLSCQQASCNYCTTNLSALAGLRKYYGYEGFRKFSEKEHVPLQQEVVEAALRGESLLAVFPTGGGKSLSFQLPAIMKGVANRGLTVVISPLQALMKDQVDVLRNRFDVTSAVAINGLLSPLERADAIERVRQGGVSLLYIAPESLRSNTILKLLKGRYIERFVIDEAHCFSSWGQDFRVDYLYIGRFLRELGKAKNLPFTTPVSCFTATAKPEVVQDIVQYFKKETGLSLTLYQTSAARRNLHYHAAIAESRDQKMQQLEDLLEKVSEPAIVYVSRTKTAVHVAEELKKRGFKAAAYHGKMEPDVKISTQDSFMRGENNIIVATSAFGMGVDKENVKMVVHYDISDSLENYQQEAGRAGRKPDLEAHCHLLFDENDLNEHFALLNQTKLSKKEIGQIWKAIKDFKRTKFTKSALEIAKQAGWETDVMELETRVKAAIAALEDVNYVRREQNSPRIFAQSILVRNVDDANKIIRANGGKFPDKLEQDAIRIYQYLISREDTMVDYLSDDLGITKETVVQILLHFKELGLLGDTRDLTALVNPVRSEKSTERCYQRSIQLEEALIEFLFPSEDLGTLKVNLRECNEKLIERGCESSTLESIRNLLQFWEHQQWIRKERLEAHHMLYSLQFRLNRSAIQEKFSIRKALAAEVVRWLIKENQSKVSSKEKREEAALQFSMLEMKTHIETSNLFLAKAALVEYESILLYLHFIGAIKLEGGLFVLYNPMTIVRLEENNLKHYTNENYAKLEKHYEKKVEQIHIIGEYARKQLQNHFEALRFVDDYFQLSYDHFINKYFGRQKVNLKQPITEKKFREIFGRLSEEQLAVVKDNKNEKILVGAGPGSGKTRVLVHKVASLLMMEDVKPEQFLMLTFSRPAATEFKERLQQLIGKAAFQIDVFTYHGFAFQLLGRVGDLKKSDNVIQQATEALLKEEIPADRIKCKSVLVVDEYQDINQQEYEFLNIIAALADEVRVIVVGDDDQNIYEFRGSSLTYMRSFVEEQKAKQYLLSKNYRAKANLVEFSNQFLRLFSSERLKAGLSIRAEATTNGLLQITLHPISSNLITPLVQDVVALRRSGTTAVLTHTNEEAMLVQHLLKQANVPARLIAAQDGFSLRQLIELRCFSIYLHQEINHELGFITQELWERSRDRMVGQFAGSADLPLTLEVIKGFERDFGKRKFWSDWIAYLQEVRTENFAFPDANKVLVSTMHKAKGKEFDHVFLLLQHYSLSTEAKKRVVYVAITRAKESLHIHTDQSYFNKFGVQDLQIIRNNEIYPAPQEIELELGMSDVWLDLFKQPKVISLVKELTAGTVLETPSKLTDGLAVRQQCVVKFSSKFKEKLTQLEVQGYKCCRAEVAHIIVWYCEEEIKEFRVVLPRLFLENCTGAATFDRTES